MDAREVFICIEKYIEYKMQESSAPRRIEAMERILQMIEKETTASLCANCLYHHELFCSKLNMNTLAAPCAYWEENSIGLDLISC